MSWPNCTAGNWLKRQSVQGLEDGRADSPLHAVGEQDFGAHRSDAPYHFVAIRVIRVS